MYGYVRSRQLEGTFPGSRTTGTWLVTSSRISKGWGIPPEAAWPYETSVWPPDEPPGIDQLAKKFRLFAYGRTRTIDDCRRLLAKERQIVAAFDIDETWQTSSTGLIEDPSLHEPNEAHTVRLVGYSDEREHFIFANSWGEAWGDKGYGYLPYRYMTDRLLEAWYQDIDRPAKPPSDESQGVVVRSFGVKDALDRVLHIVEIEDRSNDEMLGWAFTVETNGNLEVEELFVRPAFRGHGYGGRLANEIRSLADKSAKRIMCWIPHADWTEPPSQAQSAIFNHMRVSVRPSIELWASGTAVEG